MSEDSERAAPDEAMPNRGRRRDPPIIDAQANETPEPTPTPVGASGSRLVVLLGLLATGLGGTSLYLSLKGHDTSVNTEFTSALAQRLDRLERRVGAVENKPTPVVPDTAPLAARIGSLDTKADRIAAEATRAAQLAEEALRKPAGDTRSEATADLTNIEQRLATLEQRPTAAPADEHTLKAATIAMIADSLRQNLERGLPFTRDMSALEKLGADAKILALLKPLAASGAPTSVKLAQDFSSLAPVLMRVAQPAPADEDLMARISRSAASLVRIRPAGESTQDTAPALISRIEAALQRKDIAQAVTLFDTLPATMQESAREWAQRAKARTQADAAARNLIAQAIDSIAGK